MILGIREPILLLMIITTKAATKYNNYYFQYIANIIKLQFLYSAVINTIIIIIFNLITFFLIFLHVYCIFENSL